MARPKKHDPKDQALRGHGALNRRPGDVRDQLFQGSDFFDPRDLVQVRYEMLRRVRTEQQEVTETAGQFGFSRPIFYKLNAEFEREGLSGLLPRKRGPKTAHKLNAEVVDAVKLALEQNPSLDVNALVALIKQRFGIQVHRRSVERALARQTKKPRIPR
jgi:transposase